MKLLQAPDLLEHPARSSDPTCVVVAPDDPTALSAALVWLDAGERVVAALTDPARSPRADVTDAFVVVTVLAADAQGEPRPVPIVATDRHLVVVAGGRLADSVARTAAGALDARSALPETVLAIAEHTLEHVDQLARTADEIGADLKGLFTGAERRALFTQRARLLKLQHQCVAQQRVLLRDSRLADAVPGLEPAAERYAAAADSATAAYAALGDALEDLRTTVSERLTVVNTVFLPLTLAGGFFGMNFGWLGDHISSATAFVTLGIVVPVLLTLATIRSVRRLDH